MTDEFGSRLEVTRLLHSAAQSLAIAGVDPGRDEASRARKLRAAEQTMVYADGVAHNMINDEAAARLFAHAALHDGITMQTHVYAEPELRAAAERLVDEGWFAHHLERVPFFALSAYHPPAPRRATVDIDEVRITIDLDDDRDVRDFLLHMWGYGAPDIRITDNDHQIWDFVDGIQMELTLRADEGQYPRFYIVSLTQKITEED